MSVSTNRAIPFLVSLISPLVPTSTSFSSYFSIAVAPVNSLNLFTADLRFGFADLRLLDISWAQKRSQGGKWAIDLSEIFPKSSVNIGIYVHMFILSTFY